MKFTIEREQLIKPLQQVVSSSSGRKVLPIINNLLIQVVGDKLLLTSTDLEIEMIASILLSFPHFSGKTTVQARKFLDICRKTSVGEKIEVELKDKYVLIYSGRSRFLLSTLSADNFPNLNDWKSEVEFTLLQSTMKKLIEKTQFSMAYQDVRYYLNGMLFETKKQQLRTVATDGHRLAVCSVLLDTVLPNYSVIVPRKGVIELMRILDNEDIFIRIQIGSNNIRVYIKNFIFTSKLVDGRFPDYRQLLLVNNSDKILEADCNILKQAFSRTAILSNERMRGVRLYINKNTLKIIASNSDQEEAEETLDVVYTSEEMEISFNVNYVLDVLNALKCKDVRIFLTDPLSKIKIEDTESKDSTYIIMPIRL